MSETFTSESAMRTAICRVKLEIKRLEKAGFNNFDKYKFTSADDFKDHLRPLMAKHGLDVSVDEISFEMLDIMNSKKELKASCKITYAFTLGHTSGETSSPERATIILPYTGAQTAGISKSYIIKEWLKSRFLASSGDVDEEADMRRQDNHLTTLSKKDARPLFDALTKELRDTSGNNNPADLIDWASDNRDLLAQLPVDWKDELRREYAVALDTAKASEKIDGARDKPSEVEQARTVNQQALEAQRPPSGGAGRIT